MRLPGSRWTLETRELTWHAPAVSQRSNPSSRYKFKPQRVSTAAAKASSLSYVKPCFVHFFPRSVAPQGICAVECLTNFVAAVVPRARAAARQAQLWTTRPCWARGPWPLKIARQPHPTLARERQTASRRRSGSRLSSVVSFRQRSSRTARH